VGVFDRVRALFSSSPPSSSGEPVGALTDAGRDDVEDVDDIDDIEDPRPADPRTFRRSAVAVLAKVRERYAHGDYSTAVTLAKSALDDTAPTAVRTRAELELMLAHGERAERNFAGSLAAAMRALALVETYAAHVAAAIAHKNLGRIDEARAHIALARRSRGRSATLALIDAGYAFLAGEERDAVRAFDDVVARIHERELVVEHEFGWDVNVAWYWAAVDERDRCIRALRETVHGIGAREKWWLADYIGHETDFDKWRDDGALREILAACEGA
jgi:hypothetical protein